MMAPKPGWLMRFYHAAQLGLKAAKVACEHADYDQGARRGCGACRAVVALRNVLAELGTVPWNISEEDWLAYEEDMKAKASDAAKLSTGPQDINAPF